MKTKKKPVDLENLPELKALGRPDLEDELLRLVAERSARYTMGDSTSLKKETASELARGVLYCIRLHLSLHPECMGDSPDDLYEAGVLDAFRLVKRGRLLLRQAQSMPPPVVNLGYTDTLAALPAFFQRYDVDFFAHNVPCSIDYPLCHPVPEALLGVQFFNEYLRRLNTENAFLRKFPAETLTGLFTSFCGGDAGLLFNLYTPVAEAALGKALAGSPVCDLGMEDAERAALLGTLSPLSPDALGALLDHAAETVAVALSLQGEGASYLLLAARNLAPRLLAACGAGSLDGIFFPLRQPVVAVTPESENG